MASRERRQTDEGFLRAGPHPSRRALALASSHLLPEGRRAWLRGFNLRVTLWGLDWACAALDKDPPVSSINDVKVDISVVLGKATLPMQQLLRMGRGAVIELDAKQTDQVWILANNKPIARGEIMVQGDKIAISVTETLKSTG